MTSHADVPDRLPLTRERVLRAALRFVDENGVEALSMRRLGSALGVEAMSIYNHVPNKAALLDGVVEVIMSEIELPSDPGDWQQSIRQMARSYRQLALVHPNMATLIATRPFNTLASLRPVEVAFEIFKCAGFSPEDAVRAFRTLGSFVTGATLAETSELFGQGDEKGQLTPGDLPEDEFPHLMEAAPYFVGDNEREFDFAIEVILTGLEAKLKG